jgi:hypothetical protein
MVPVGNVILDFEARLDADLDLNESDEPEDSRVSRDEEAWDPRDTRDREDACEAPDPVLADLLLLVNRDDAVTELGWVWSNTVDIHVPESSIEGSVISLKA